MAQYDVAVIGGGVHGASALYHLTQMGVDRAVLLERRRLAAAATGRSTGIIRHHYSHPLTVQLTWWSTGFFRSFQANLGQDIGYVRNGVLILAPESEAEALRRSVEAHRRLGIPEVLVEPEGLRDHHPGLDQGDVAAAAYDPEAAYADPYSVTVGFVRAAEAAGARVLLGARMKALGPLPGGGFSIETGDGSLEASQVLVAGGAWTPSLLKPLGVDVPVQPLRLTNAVFRYPGGYDVKLPTVLDLTGHFYFRPEGRHVLVGNGEGLGDVDPDHFDEGMPYGFVEEISAKMAHRMPSFAEASPMAGWRGLDGASPDFHPIVGPVPGVEGLYVAAGMSGHGFKLSPAVGRCLAEHMVKGKYETFDLKPFGLDRFDRGELLASNYSMRILA